MKIGIAGLGTIGRVVARHLIEKEEALVLDCVAAGDADKARAYLAAAGWDVPVVSIAEMARRADVIVDCAPSATFRTIGEAVGRAAGGSSSPPAPCSGSMRCAPPRSARSIR